MKTIKVWFPDFGFNIPDDFIIYQILKRNYNLMLDENPDYIIFSDGRYNYLNYDCIRIRYHVEQQAPDFDLVDYEIGYDEISYDDRYLRCPWYMLSFSGKYSYSLNFKKLHDVIQLDRGNLINRGFCSYLSSNPQQLSGRDELVSIISQYRVISSGGKHKNNVGFFVDDKIKFLSDYKFNIAAENSIYNGYTTEKIYEAFIANSVPIYLGNPKIYKEFNPKAFVDVSKFENYEKVLDHIVELDNNDDMYLEMLNQPKILEDSIVPSIEDLENFLKSIFDQPLSISRRRPHSQWTRYKANVIYLGGNLSLLYASFPNGIKSIIRLFTRKVVK